MLKTLSLIGSSTILQSIDMADEDEVIESNGNRTSLSNSSASTRSTKAGYLTPKGAKRGGGNIKKDVKAAKGSDYLTSATKKAFNHLWHSFTQAPIIQHFDPERYIQIETDASSYIIGRVLNQVTSDNLGR